MSVYRIIFISPSREERRRLMEDGITTMGLSMIEMMYFNTINDVQTYIEHVKTIYHDIDIQYRIYADYRPR